MTTTAGARMEIEAAQRVYGPLFAEFVSLLNDHDPVDASAGRRAPADEYAPAAATILPLLIGAEAPDDVGRVVHLELLRWFSPAMVGPEGRHRALGDALWRAYRRHAQHDPVSLAAPAWRAGGLDLHVGRLLHDALPAERRPAWAVGPLRSACTHLVAPAEVTRIVDLADDPARWSAAHGAFFALRELVLGSYRRSARRERALTELAELVAKIVYNASGGPAPFDAHAGWLLACRVRAMIVALGDRAFAADAERALFSIRAGMAQRAG